MCFRKVDILLASAWGTFWISRLQLSCLERFCCAFGLTDWVSSWRSTWLFVAPFALVGSGSSRVLPWRLKTGDPKSEGWHGMAWHMASIWCWRLSISSFLLFSSSCWAYQCSAIITQDAVNGAACHLESIMGTAHAVPCALFQQRGLAELPGWWPNQFRRGCKAGLHKITQQQSTRMQEIHGKYHNLRTGILLFCTFVYVSLLPFTITSDHRLSGQQANATLPSSRWGHNQSSALFLETGFSQSTSGQVNTRKPCLGLLQVFFQLLLLQASLAEHPQKLEMKWLGEQGSIHEKEENPDQL